MNNKDETMFWADQIAREVLERENKLDRGTKVFRTEMGVGASGIPHVGSAGDGVRNFVVNLALKDLGAKSEFIAFSDDRDGLRKVPMGFPDSLEDDIGKPVSLIKDPFNCHGSFADHFSSILAKSFNKLGLKFILKRAHEEYSKGKLDNEVIDILTRAKDVGKIIEEVTGQDKFLRILPFLPICGKCKRIYTTSAYKFDPKTKKISYKCDQEFMGSNSNTGKNIPIKGCGYEGEAGIRDGKVAWKAEFACRWRALKINYEAYGKDILDSVKANDRISREILNWEPPLHSLYEMLTERSGKKISKSASRVFTPEMWFKYASPESLRLLFLKRLRTTRVVDLDSIPIYMDEVDNLAKVYFGIIKIPNEKELVHMKRLYEYMNFLKPIKKPTFFNSYNILTNILIIAKDKKVVKSVLKKSKHIPEKLSKQEEKMLDEKLDYVENWMKDNKKEEVTDIELSEKQKNAIRKLAKELEKKWDEEGLQARLYGLAKEEGLTMGEFFKGVYSVLLHNERGPRLAPFILALGKEKVAKKFEKV